MRCSRVVRNVANFVYSSFSVCGYFPFCVDIFWKMHRLALVLSSVVGPTYAERRKISHAGKWKKWSWAH